APLDLARRLLAVAVAHQQLEVAAVIDQPVEVEQPLIDDVLGALALVFDDDGIAVFIDAERIHAPTVGGDELGGEETHPEQGFQIALEQGLQATLQRRGRALQLDQGIALGAEQFQIAHASTSRRRLCLDLPARAALIRASSSAAGSSLGSCGTSLPEKASLRMDCRRAVERASSFAENS